MQILWNIQVCFELTIEHYGKNAQDILYLLYTPTIFIQFSYRWQQVLMQHICIWIIYDVSRVSKIIFTDHNLFFFLLTNCNKCQQYVCWLIKCNRTFEKTQWMVDVFVFNKLNMRQAYGVWVSSCNSHKINFCTVHSKTMVRKGSLFQFFICLLLFH